MLKTVKIFALSFALATAVSAQSLCEYVDPFIGTGGHGHTFPGPTVPNGMVQPSPDTRIDQWDACSGYYFDDSTINGFSHTHCNGTGCCDYGDLLLMPTVGAQDVHYTGKSQQLAWASRFSHEDEYAEPGYYSVFLQRYGVKAEMTTAAHGMMHRWTFPKADDAGVILDFDYSLQRQNNRDMRVEVLSDTEIIGHKRTSYWAPDRQTNFYCKFSKPFTFKLVNDTITDLKGQPYVRCKVLLNFATRQGEQVLCKVGISAVDTDGARTNVLTDIPAWDFEGVRHAAYKQWEDYLGKIEIKGATDEQKKIFYTAMYHTGLQPYLYTDADGRHWGMNKKAHRVKDPMFTVYSLWDTFRAYHPLMTIIQPDFNQQLIRSLIRKSDEGGVLPMWELSANYTATMIGYHAVPVIVDAFMKGQRDFDVEKAFAACVRTAEGDTTGIKATPNFRMALMPQSKKEQHTRGYAPFDNENETVAKGLEYAYNDWCIAQMAKALGKKDEAKRFSKYALNYRNYFDAQTGFMRGRNSKGEWRTPFSPFASDHRSDDYCEGTAWQWTWFVPHDVNGLVKLMGGKKNFINKLDSLFTVSSQLEGDKSSVDISGLIGQYAHGNEPSHATIHFYNYVGQPWKTQELCDSVLHSLYFADPNGLSGNEDCGQMSAWYILNAMGFYQVAPGDPTYSIGRPLFEEVTINLPKGKTFRIVCHNQSRENKHIRSMKLNGRTLKTPFFSHEELMNGGILEVWMDKN